MIMQSWVPLHNFILSEENDLKVIFSEGNDLKVIYSEGNDLKVIFSVKWGLRKRMRKRSNIRKKRSYWLSGQVYTKIETISNNFFNDCNNQKFNHPQHTIRTHRWPSWPCFLKKTRKIVNLKIAQNSKFA